MTGRVKVIMPVFQPERNAFLRQLASLAAQTGTATRLYAVLDGLASVEDAEPWLAGALQAHGASIVPAGAALGVKGAVARGLAVALGDPWTDGRPCAYAFADQDDVWSPDKLVKTLALLARPGAVLAHCDARVVNAQGKTIAPSLHRFENRYNSADLADNILLNSATGMCCVFTEEAARATLRLLAVDAPALLHDHLLAVAAHALGEVHFCDEPLVDYVQHAENQVGAKPYRMTASGILGYVMGPRLYIERARLAFTERRRVAAALCALPTEDNVKPDALRKACRLFRAGGEGWPATLPLFWIEIARHAFAGRYRHAGMAVRCAVGTFFTR